MRIAIVGCGYVADLYITTLRNYPELAILGVWDRDPERTTRFASYHSLPTYSSLEMLLEDPQVNLVVNLTNPASHFEVSKAALEAGKHVYSEKPLAMCVEDAEHLVNLAEARGLSIAGAPCSLLGETAQTLWKALREGAIGKPRLVYAEINDGPVHLMNPHQWSSVSGTPWPVKDEYEVGCTLEHAGYYLTWLCAFFGPARTVKAFTSNLVVDKGEPVDVVTPDFSVACIEFVSGVVARLTCSIYAPHDHTMQLIGDEGVLTVDECWDYGSPIHLRTRTPATCDRVLSIAKLFARRLRGRPAKLTSSTPLALQLENQAGKAALLGIGPKQYPLARKPDFVYQPRGARMDFARGIVEQVQAIRESRPCRLSARYSLHINELVLAIQNMQHEKAYHLVSTFSPIEPMPWAV